MRPFKIEGESCWSDSNSRFHLPIIIEPNFWQKSSCGGSPRGKQAFCFFPIFPVRNSVKGHIGGRGIITMLEDAALAIRSVKINTKLKANPGRTFAKQIPSTIA